MSGQGVIPDRPNLVPAPLVLPARLYEAAVEEGLVKRGDPRVIPNELLPE